MTTSFDQTPPSPPPPPPPAQPSFSAPPRVLRRSRADRVGAGVAGGLGEYFGVDPVLFRVLFATAAFFGGAGVLAYLLAWVAIPEQGTAHAPIDRFVGGLRRRRIPVWIVAIAAALLLWGVAFSWWAPGPFFPVMIVVIVLVAIFGRRAPRSAAPPPAADGPADGPADGLADDVAPTVDLTKQAPAAQATSTGPAWVGDTRQWVSEARAASRARRRRAFPVRITAICALAVTLAILAAVDAGVGLPLPVYFWVTLGIALLALLVGMVLRRTPWSLTSLLVPAILGLIAFGGTAARMHDGFGQRDWSPTAASDIESNYRLAFGQGVLDLRNVTLDSPRTIHVTVAAGQVRIVLPTSMNATVKANVHFGVVTVDGQDYNPGDGWRSRGANVNRTILPPASATGIPVTIDVHLADGNIAVVHR